MTPRRTGLALLVAAAAAGIALWVARPDRGASDAGAGAVLLPGLKQRVNDVTEVRISRGDGTRTTLRRTDGAWTVVERGYPADAGKLRRLLLEASDMSVVEEKTRDPARFPVLGVEDVSSAAATGTQVEVLAGEQRWAFVLGKNSGTREVFARVERAPGSVLARPQLAADANPQRWLDATLLDLRSERVQSVEVTLPGQAPYVARRAAATDADLALSPLPRGREPTGPSAATGLASALAGLQLDDVRAVAAGQGIDGAGAPAARGAAAIVTTFDGLSLALRGTQDGARRFVAIEASASTAASAEVAAEAERINSRTRGRQFELASYKYDALFRPLEEMLKPVNGSGR